MKYREERHFGVLIGLLFLLLAGRWYFKGNTGSATITIGTLALVLIVLGVSFPRALVAPLRVWMALAHRMGQVMTTVVLFVIYFLVITPIGVIMRLARRDILNRRGQQRTSFWVSTAEAQRGRDHYRRMF